MFGHRMKLAAGVQLLRHISKVFRQSDPIVIFHRKRIRHHRSSDAPLPFCFSGCRCLRAEAVSHHPRRRRPPVTPRGSEKGGLRPTMMKRASTTSLTARRLSSRWAGPACSRFAGTRAAKRLQMNSGAAKFLKEYGPKVRRWNDKVNLLKWIESRCRNQKSKAEAHEKKERE